MTKAQEYAALDDEKLLARCIGALERCRCYPEDDAWYLTRCDYRDACRDSGRKHVWEAALAEAKRRAYEARQQNDAALERLRQKGVVQ